MAANGKAPLWDGLMQIRDRERSRVQKSSALAEADKCPVEVTPFGILRWYTHPMMEEPAIKTYSMWVQEIPAKSRSGRIRHQGGRVHFVWKGQGHTILDGVEYQWETDDTILIPIKPEGVEFQHFNDGDDTALLISAELNMTESMGVDLGVAFEVIEPAPEYREN